MVIRSQRIFGILGLFGILAAACVGIGIAGVPSAPAQAEERLPWRPGGQRLDYGQQPAYRQRNIQTAQDQNRAAPPDPYGPVTPPSSTNNRPPAARDAYRPPQQPANSYPERSSRGQHQQRHGSNRRYAPSDTPPPAYRDDDDYRDRAGRQPRVPHPSETTYSQNEVVDAGHRFFGSLSNGLAKAIQWAFKRSGRPNGYILGEDAGGAFIAGLRYGEGKLYTKNYGVRRVFWQGPSIGYDFGGDGNRTMTLVYNLRSPRDVYRRFGGVQGAAYLVGGVSVQLLKADDVTLAPIRTGVGVRIGANVGYLKFTRRPTWNPF